MPFLDHIKNSNSERVGLLLALSKFSVHPIKKL
jgi:hypothetical protein